ncbi:MAG: hypothetical protein KAJ28_12520, partial [Flavobacteriaceae bacterium]|nr:hypothetical protein [Flavobacteriaceae bacterium]
MKNKIYILFALVLFFQTNNVFSQGCEGDEPITQNDSLSPPKVKIFGYLQSQYDYTFTDENENTFRFKRARIGVRGKVYEDFSYYFMLEASPFIGGVGSAYLLDAFITYDKYNWARISVGAFKQPFGQEVTTACWNLTTIDRAIVSDQLVVPQRDYGLAIFGGNKYTKLNYALAIMNGKGLNEKDNNTKKDIIARATYKVTDFMTLGGSFRYGYPKSSVDDSRTTVGGDLALVFNNLKINAEYIYDEGAFDPGADTGCGSEPIALGERRAGGYIMAAYETKWKVQPVFKYEFFDANRDTKDKDY